MDLRDPNKKPDGLVWNYGNLRGVPPNTHFWDGTDGGKATCGGSAFGF